MLEEDKKTEVKPESPEMEAYFESIDAELRKAYDLATTARKKGYDPEDKVDIPIARNMAERVEGLMSAVAPQLIGTGMTDRIQELEAEHGKLSWDVALLLAEEVAKEKFCKFKDIKEAMEVGIRAGFAYHTVGIVSAPLEGFVELKIRQRRSDGKEYIAMLFAGPIRGAGGTACAVSVLIGDYVRKKMGYSEFDPDEKEINRFYTELEDYHDRITNLQYRPSKEEVLFLAKHIAVQIDGEPTERVEVSNYKDLPRVDTNKIRSGVCLVLSMIALKAKKLWKRVQKWETSYEIDWRWLEEFLKLQKKMQAQAQEKESGGEKKKAKLEPNYTFIADLVAGRPVLGYPMRPGGLRLRYGRCRTSGYSAAAIHPLTQRVLDNYIACGTQVKVERPGKAAALTTCDSIESPIVKLDDGSVVQLSERNAQLCLKHVEKILYLGDILFNYGDFSENGHKLVPAGYCEEWWVKDLEKATVDLFGSLDVDKLSELVGIDAERMSELFDDPFTKKPTAHEAIQISTKLSYLYIQNFYSFGTV